MSSAEESEAKDQNESSEDRSENDKDSDSEVESEKSNVSETSNLSKANKTENDDEEAEANRDEILFNKFDLTKLIISNETKLEVIPNEKKDSNTFITTIAPNYNKNKTSLKILNEINNELDNLFNDLSKSIKTFRSHDDHIKPEQSNNFHNSNIGNETKFSYKQSIKKDNFIEDIYTSDEDTKQNKLQNSQRSSNKVYVNKEVNTSYQMRDFPKTNIRNSEENNFKKKQSFTHTNPYNYTLKNTPNNITHMRTVEDLYRPNKTLPVIYSNNYDKRNNLNYPIKNYQRDSYEKELRRSKELLIQNYAPKNIDQAIDILLDKYD